MIDLPEPATLLVSEIVGNEPLSERILEVFLDARKRPLRAGGRSIPKKLRMSVALLGPEPSQEPASPDSDWLNGYGVDLSPLVAAAAATPPFSAAEIGRLAGRSRLADGPILEIDLTTLDTLEPDSTVAVEVERDGDVGAATLTWEIILDDERTITVDLDSAGSHWRLPFWRFAEPMSIQAGESL